MGQTFYIMRHGQTPDNINKIASGYYSDPWLTEAGIEQAKKSSEIIDKLNIKQVWTSPDWM